jgi:glycosyltransferase involved in cell wall biosynthesis
VFRQHQRAGKAGHDLRFFGQQGVSSLVPKRPIDVMMIGLRSIDGAQGGVERHVRSLADELDALGLKVCIVERSPYSDGGDRSWGSHGEAKVIWSPRSASLEAIVHSVLATLWAGVKRPRVLHIHAIGPSIVTPLARLLGLKIVSTHHGRDYDREKWGTLARFILRVGEWCQARLAQGRICVGKTLSHELEAEYGAPFTFIPNAVKLPELTGKATVLAKLGLEPGKYLINVGRLVPEKRQDHLVRAFHKLNRSDLKLVLLGKADHASAYSENLQQLAANTPGVIMAGFRQGEELVQLIANAALFVLPSSHEGMPIAALEAMSLSRPVLLSDIPANLDLQLAPDNYFALGSIDELAAGLERHLARDTGGLPSADWENVLAAYSWSTVAQQTLGVYRDVSATLSAEAPVSP